MSRYDHITGEYLPEDNPDDDAAKKAVNKENSEEIFVIKKMDLSQVRAEFHADIKNISGRSLKYSPLGPPMKLSDHDYHPLYGSNLRTPTSSIYPSISASNPTPKSTTTKKDSRLDKEIDKYLDTITDEEALNKSESFLESIFIFMKIIANFLLNSVKDVFQFFIKDKETYLTFLNKSKNYTLSWAKKNEWIIVSVFACIILIVSLKIITSI